MVHWGWPGFPHLTNGAWAKAKTGIKNNTKNKLISKFFFMF